METETTSCTVLLTKRLLFNFRLCSSKAWSSNSLFSSISRSWDFCLSCLICVREWKKGNFSYKCFQLGRCLCLRCFGCKWHGGTLFIYLYNLSALKWEPTTVSWAIHEITDMASLIFFPPWRVELGQELWPERKSRDLLSCCQYEKSFYSKFNPALNQSL